MKKNNDPFIMQMKASFERMAKKYIGYSWRRLAKKIGISHSFLLQIIKGTKKFPAERIDLLVEALELDEFSKSRILNSYLESYIKSIQESSKEINVFLKQNKNYSVSNTQSSIFEELPLSKANIFKPWYNAALLDLVETRGFQPRAKWIAQRLSITEQQAEESLAFLQNEKLIEITDSGLWQKSQLKVRVPSRNSTAIMREFYGEMFYKANIQMRRATAEEEIQRRLILGAICSANSEKWKAMKLILTDQLFSNAETLSEGECDEVYCLMTVAVPLTK